MGFNGNGAEWGPMQGLNVPVIEGWGGPIIEESLSSYNNGESGLATRPRLSL